MVRELMDTQRQNFWKESIEKEAYVRLAWHEKYSKEFAKESRDDIRRKKRPDMVPKPVMTLKLPQIERSKKEDKAKKEAEAKASFAALASKDPNALLVEMRPASSGTKALLYKGFSKLGEGRYAYLQQRKLKKPEVKYEFPITNSWEYGWRLGDVVTEMKAPQFGRNRIVKDSFYRTNGIL
ncbi:protein SPMIP1-like [Ptychodera flava]|uniref:protein SPMIP1-like n=1 Tax=Ptychodera flava TaxID=63121 RepID=UPI003969DEF6